MTISLRPRGPFSLPAPLVLALTDDGGEAVALRAVWVEEAGEVEVDFVSDLPAERVERHAARVLSLDVDGSGLAEVGARDPVVGRLLAEAGGRRPVCFGTPFEAAVWAVLSQRVSMAQAGRVKDALAAALGTRMEIGGEEVVAFPGPAALASLESFEGVWDSKLERIRALAAARRWPATSTRRSCARSTSTPRSPTSSRSRASARSERCSSSRAEPATRTSHPRPSAASAPRSRAAYGLDEEPDEAKLAELSEAWRPYRAWVTWLLRSADSG